MSRKQVRTHQVHTEFRRARGLRPVCAKLLLHLRAGRAARGDSLSPPYRDRHSVAGLAANVDAYTVVPRGFTASVTF